MARPLVGNMPSIGKLRLPRRWLLLPILSLTLVLAGCAAGKKWRYLPATPAQERSIYVVSHGWHTGVVLAGEDLGSELSFVKEYVPQGRYYEFGWGEAEFYQAEKVTVPIFLKAVFWRNPSVMHLFSVPVSPKASFTESEIVELNLSETGLKHLRERLRASFTFDGNNRPYPLKDGIHGESRFFKGAGYYVIFDTCNTWTAKVLASGGVPMDTVFTLRAAGVMRQVKLAQKEYLRLRQFGKPMPEPVAGPGPSAPYPGPAQQAPPAAAAGYPSQ